MCRPLARLLLTQSARRAPSALVTLLPRNTVQVQNKNRLIGQQRNLYPPPKTAQAQRRSPAASQALNRHRVVATNKCSAQNNKTRRVIRATKDTNGHWTVGTAERPCEVRRTPSARPTSPTSD